MSNSRDISRDMRRLASLYNGVAFEQMRAMCWDVLVDHYLADDGFLEISAQVCQKPEAQKPLFGTGVSESMKRTFVSINKCVAAIVYNFAWLAFCVKGLNIDIEEITLAEQKPVHKVELQYTGQYAPTRTDYHHTILLFVPKNGEDAIAADASYAQYSFDNGIDTFREYLATKALRYNNYCARRHYFGQSFQEWEESEEDVWHESKAKAIIRTTNNVMARGLEAVGGMKNLLDLSAEGFQAARDIIFAALKREMEALRRQLETIDYGPQARFLEQLEDLVRDCDGTGHQTCMLSLQHSV